MMKGKAEMTSGGRKKCGGEAGKIRRRAQMLLKYPVGHCRKMKIIIAPSDSEMPSAPTVMEINLRRALLPAAALLLLMAAGIYGTARLVAEEWLRERAPPARALAEEIDAQRREEDARRAEQQKLALEDEIADLRAGIAELRGRGAALAGRLGLDGFVAEAPSLECGADELSGGAKTAGVAAYRDAFHFYRHRYDVMMRYGAMAGVTFDTVPMRRPVLGRNWLSSRFGMRRDPLTGRRAFHSGYDYAARRGSPVLAAATGMVTYAGRLGNYGNAIRITHGEGVSTLYGHLRAMNVAPGRYVRRGEVIGEVGSTGRSTGPHLHYEVRINNRPRPVSGAVKKLRAARDLPPEWEI